MSGTGDAGPAISPPAATSNQPNKKENSGEELPERKVQVVGGEGDHSHGEERQRAAEMQLELDEEAIEVDCTNQRLQTLEQVHQLQKLHTLILRANNIRHLEHLTKPECGLASLTHLDLYSNLLSTDEHLQLLPSLTHLDLSFNEIRKVNKAGALTALTELYLVSNKITKIQGEPSLHSRRHPQFPIFTPITIIATIATISTTLPIASIATTIKR